MDTQLIALLMFLLLTYLLFHRPASASRRCPTELNFQLGRAVDVKSEILRKKSASSPKRTSVRKSFAKGVAPGFVLILPLSAAAMAQSSTPNAAKDGKDNAELNDEMRQMRRLIERLEERI